MTRSVVVAPLHTAADVDLIPLEIFRDLHKQIEHHSPSLPVHLPFTFPSWHIGLRIGCRAYHASSIPTKSTVCLFTKIIRLIEFTKDL